MLGVLDLDDAGFGWTVQLVARALRAPGMRVVERPATFRRRRGGRSKVSGSLRASIAAGRRMIACALDETRRRPVIALMAKAPRAGHAKTRLAATGGVPGQDAAPAPHTRAWVLRNGGLVGARPVTPAFDPLSPPGD